jgi:hypothetical protein
LLGRGNVQMRGWRFLTLTQEARPPVDLKTLVCRWSASPIDAQFSLSEVGFYTSIVRSC